MIGSTWPPLATVALTRSNSCGNGPCFGALAELVAPASWRESLRVNAEAMVHKYAK